MAVDAVDAAEEADDMTLPAVWDVSVENEDAAAL